MTTQSPQTDPALDLSLPPQVIEPLPTIERELAAAADQHSKSESLRAAIRYALLGGGKRIRPLLTWHSAAALGGDPHQSLPACIAIELIHAFSLVHDDLPAMDNDDLRRGKPTLHIHTSEAMAILAGDAMLATAFAHIHKSMPPALAAAITTELATAAATMIDGQVYDTLQSPDQSNSLPTDDAQRLLTIHHAKTGALIKCAAHIGAISALGPDHSNDPRLAAITTYAESLGIMFQAVDDLLDVQGSSTQTGKHTNKDAQAGKLTFPSVHGIQTSKNIIQELHQSAIQSLEPLGQPAEPLRQLAEFLAHRTH